MNTKITQYLHRPNATELGMGNTHETYMLVNTSITLSDIFPPTKDVDVEDTTSGKIYTLRATSGNEFRINQMGNIYRDYDVHPGDEILITNIQKNENSITYVTIKKYERVIFIVSSKGAEILNIERLEAIRQKSGNYEISIYDNGMANKLSISYKGTEKKRSDSPKETSYYDIKINEQKLSNGTHYLTLSNKSTLQTLLKSEYNTIQIEDNLIQSLPTQAISKESAISSIYRPYIAAIKSKPFLLLAGISGTGKSRIVRELARACWDTNDKEYKEQKPRNFEMVQVKPNWHDSTELIGYVSRVSGEPVFVAGKFLNFIAKAWEETDVPYFFCLDEMNLAPVEQYFAEYLSVVESRKIGEDGEIKTDTLLEPVFEAEYDKNTGGQLLKPWYKDLVKDLLAKCSTEKQFALTKQFEEYGISIPKNLIVVGTVNMDETTFSFSRKVLDRAMTIEMNEVDLYGGLDERYETIGKLSGGDLIGTAVEGVDVYADNKEVCDKVLAYLKSVNDVLEHTPFKIAYRTRNEFLLYVVNNLPYNKDENGNALTQDYVIARALDEITNMKILPRIEGDDTKVKETKLDELKEVIERGLKNLTGEEQQVKSVSLAKLDAMKERLQSGYTSYWS